jgi:unspecific monooxygenase
LDGVVAESLRLYPPAWLIPRTARTAGTVAGYVLPKGSRILLSPYLTHRHPLFWEDPEEFRPERFLNSFSVPGSRPLYLPFGAGPHHCVAANYVRLHVKLVLVELFRMYELEVTDAALDVKHMPWLAPKRLPVRMRTRGVAAMPTPDRPVGHRAPP